MRRSNEHTEKAEGLALTDAEAFTTIYKTYYRQSLDTAYHICRCKLLCEEIVQEVFVKLWINKEELKKVKDIEAYVFILTRNQATDWMRRRKTEREALSEYAYLYSKESESQDWEKKELKSALEEAVEQLHPQQKRVYQLKKFYGWRRDKIAQSLNISENTVKATMQKAISSVKKYMIERVEI
jgi:RNA polymerase sigma-70 factor (ECF subfamily)